MLIYGGALLVSSLLVPHLVPHLARAPPRASARAVATLGARGDALLGEVVRTDGSLIVISPEDRELAKVGGMLEFAGGGVGVIMAERCGLYFAACLSGAPPVPSEPVALLARNLTMGFDGGAPWGGLHDHLGRPEGAPAWALADAVPLADGGLPVFAEPVPAARRRPIGASLHTGVVAIEALTPVGRGQSMMLFGPDGLPAGAGRTDLALRVLDAQHALASGVRSVLVLTGADEPEQASALAALEASGALANTKVLRARSDVEGVLAASVACTLAQGAGRGADEDVLVVVDCLRPFLSLWGSMCAELQASEVVVSPEEEGSQQRAFYARIVERAARCKGGDGSLTLLLLQPSPSVVPDAADSKPAYCLADFEAAGYSKRVCGRVRLLEERGIALSEAVLVKLGIPVPGSDHPSSGAGQRSAQHLEELTSLVDGHIDLRENLAAAGRVPPIDAGNSLTRIGVGSSALRPLSTSPAMAAVSSALRLELASANDGVHCEPAQAARAAAYMAALQQRAAAPLPLGEQVALLHTAASGLLDGAVAGADAQATAELLAGLLDAVRAGEPELLPRITKSGLLADGALDRLAELARAHVGASA